MIEIEIVYIDDANKQTCLQLAVNDECTVLEALQQSDIAKLHPNLDIKQCALGIFSKKAQLDTVLKPGDRIEIYRPLKITPMEKRRLLARKKKS